MGSFDILHIDHISLFERCREIATDTGQVIVGVNSDTFIFEMKERMPAFPTDQRMGLVKAIKDVDRVFMNDDTSLQWCVDHFEPDYLAIGSDWFGPGKDYMRQIGMTWSDLAARGVMVVVVPSFERIHSSAVRAPQGKRVESGLGTVIFPPDTESWSQH